jgi:hypothetical protein
MPGWPKVKTGPTKGQDRHRTEQGKIHKKRSDAGVPRGPREDDPKKKS